MDWTEDFIERFNHYPELKNLKEKQLHGSLQLNFCAGKVQSFDLKTHGRAVSHIQDQPLKQGG